MNKKTLPLRTLAITLLLVTFSVATSMAQAVGDKFKVDKLYYEITKLTPAEVAVVPQNTGKPYWNDSDKPTGNITIPAKVTHNGKDYTVTNIGASAFYECRFLSSVTIPSSVTSIGAWAFKYCRSLIAVTIPNSVTSIGSMAFYYCSSLKAIISKIEDLSTVTMGWDVFDGVDKNTCILYVPSGKVSAYQGAEQWKDFKNIKEEKDYSPLIGTKFKHDGLYYLITAENTVQLVLQNTGKPYWNAGEAPTGTLTLPAKVTHKGKQYAVTSIGYAAFNGCSSLSSVTIPSSVTSIGDGAFDGCSSLTAVTIPNSVTSIGGGAFASCSSLTAVTIPNSVTSIGGTAFESCSSLTAVTIPSSVTSIGWSAFRFCSSLTSVTIGNSVTSIGAWAFFDCGSLTSVSIPSSVTTIGKRAFKYCSSLTAIVSKIADPSKVTMGDNVFDGVDKNTCIVYVPKGKVSVYKGAKQWKDFKNIKEATTGVNQNDDMAHTVIYPTLVENGFTVETTGKVLEIYNLSGQKVQTVPLTSNKQFVNVSNLRQGVYLAKVKDWAVRFVKQ